MSILDYAGYFVIVTMWGAGWILFGSDSKD